MLVLYAALNIGGASWHFAAVFGFHGGHSHACPAEHVSQRHGHTHSPHQSPHDALCHSRHHDVVHELTVACVGSSEGGVDCSRSCALCDYYSQGKSPAAYSVEGASLLPTVDVLIATAARLDRESLPVYQARGPPTLS